MSRSSSPTEQNIIAAQELELEEDVLEDVSDTLHDTKAVSPAASSLKTPSKVQAAAAKWESSASGTSSSSMRPALSTSSSFRSIPAAPSRSTLCDGHLSASPTPSNRSLPTPSTAVITSQEESQHDDLQTPRLGNNPDSFAEIALGEASKEQSPVERAPQSSHLSPIPPTPSPLEPSPNSGLKPPSQEGTKSKSFFSSALSFGGSGGSHASELSSVAPKSTPATTPSAGGSGWRSAMSNLIGNRSGSSTPALTTEEPRADQVPSSPLEGATNSSTSFILQRVSSPRASRDRRISRELGATDKLREGFERVRNEMESAAREMRREAAAGADQDSLGGEGGMDWVFWGAVVQDYEQVARERPKELSRAIQQGVPDVIRGAIWQLMSSSKSTSLEETYKALLKMPSSHDKAIAKDLSRTFPTHKFFQEGVGSGQESLFMVVKAYSLYDQEVGYTQGLAFIVAALLLNMPDEEAFCVLVRLMDSYNLRSHFLPEMPGLQLRLFQFDRLLEEILPLLHTHFVKKGVKSSMYASQWFMTLFSYRFPLSLVYRVLDIVFAEGIEAIFRFSLALLSKSEDKLVQLDFEQILSYLQTDLFQVYHNEMADDKGAEAEAGGEADEEWRANDFVKDAYEVRITPFMLDSYASEYDEQRRESNKHAIELDQLRNANRSLSAQVKQLEASLAAINTEHVTIVRQLVMSKIEKEEMENELVRYKMMYAELAHAQQDALSTHSRFSAGSSMSPHT